MASAPLALQGCLTPTLPPLPPPAAPNLTIVSESEVVLEGKVARPDSHVLALNTATGQISGQVVTDGRYRFPVTAKLGDLLELWYRSGRHSSDITEVEVRLPVGAPELDGTVDAGADASMQRADADAP